VPLFHPPTRAFGNFRCREPFYICKLNDLYSSPSISRIMKVRRMGWVDHVARMGEKRNSFRLLVGRPEGRRPLGRPRRRWVDSIMMDLLEVGWGDVDWFGLAQDRAGGELL
jgi:hypothetical protein